VSTGRGAVAGVAAVTRYQFALLVRGGRWVPPLVLLGFALATATTGGPPAGDALAFGGAALVPVSAWLTRIVLVGDPPAARACLMAAVGAARTQLGCLLAAVLAAGALGAATAAVLTALLSVGQGQGAGGGSAAGGGAARFLATLASGLVTGLVCALLGVALGAVCNPPVLRRADAAVVVGGIGVTLCLASSGSPAYAAISDLSRTPRAVATPLAWEPLAVAVGLLLLCGAVSVWTAVRRGVR
jgi:hypothetical protein